MHSPVARPQVILMECSDTLEVLAKRLFELQREHRESIFFSFSIPHQDLFPLQIDILDPQSAAFQQPQPCTIEQASHKLMRILHETEDPLDLFRGQHLRQMLGLFGPNNIVDPTEVYLENLVVEKNKSVESLVLGAGSHLPLRSKLGQILGNFWLTHGVWVTLVVE